MPYTLTTITPRSQFRARKGLNASMRSVLVHAATQEVSRAGLGDGGMRPVANPPSGRTRSALGHRPYLDQQTRR
jgi:hypothetical protein